MLTLLGLPKSEKDSELTGLGPKGRDPRRPALSQSCLKNGSGLADWEEDLHAGQLRLAEVVLAAGQTCCVLCPA